VRAKKNVEHDEKGIYFGSATSGASAAASANSGAGVESKAAISGSRGASIFFL
jgi:hypothetical protein